MKRVIRSKVDGKYLHESGAWSEDVQEALCFDDVLSALHAAKKYQLERVELVLMMGEKPSAYDVALEL